MSDFENDNWLDPDEDVEASFPTQARQPRRRKDFGLAERDAPSGGRFAELARGEAMVSLSRWRMSGFDALIKLFLLGIYVLTFALIVPPLVPLVFDAVTNGALLFIFPFALAAMSLVVLVLAVVDSYGTGLSYAAKDDAGEDAIVSYRDRSFNILMSGALVFIHFLFGLLWVVWYAHHYELDTDSDFKTFSRGVAQYYALCATNVAIYLIALPFAGLAVYSNSRYQLTVHLVDAFSQRTVGKRLEDVF